MQSCPELAGEAVDYEEFSVGDGLDVPASPVLLLALDQTLSAEHFDHVKDSIAKVICPSTQKL